MMNLENNEGVHMINPLDPEFTLCGWSFDVDPVLDKMPDGVDALRDTKKRTITCRDCIRIIEECRRARVRRV